MMKQRILLIILALMMTRGQISAQKIHNLKIGDTVPEMKFEMVNYKTPDLSLSDLKGKYVLLDFWATTCTSCIAQFPKLDSLQEVFGDKLKIILVHGKDKKRDKNYIAAFLKKRKNNASEALRLPSAVNDTIAAQFFAHRIIPHYAWINADRRVAAITSANEVNTGNIKRFISGEKLNLRQKADTGNEAHAQLFLKEKPQEVKFRSLFTGYLDGVTEMKAAGGFSGEKISRWCLINTSLHNMYRVAFNYPFYSNRVITEGVDRNKIMVPKVDKAPLNWGYENTYCYELVTSPISRVAVLEQLKIDLTRFLSSIGIQVAVEKRQVKCLVIEQKKVTRTDIGYLEQEKIDIKVADVKAVRDMVMCLDRFLSIPVVDETELSDSNISLGTELKDLKQARYELNKRGFELTEKIKELDMLVYKNLQ